MLKANAIIPALLLSVVAFAPASALPGKLSEATCVAPMQLKIDDRDRHVGDRGDRFGDRNFDHRGDRDFGHRGDRDFGRGFARREPPRGWRRFGYRPDDWRSRGCLEIGPAWFCP